MTESGTRSYRLLGSLTLLILAFASMFLRVRYGQSVPHTVTISPTCTVSSDRPQDPPGEVQANVGDTIAWISQDPKQSFQVRFEGKTPFHTGNFAGAPVLQIDSVASAQLGKTVTGDITCQNGADTDPICYFPYKVWSTGGTGSCDPGVRVVPPSLIFVWQWVELQFRALFKS